MSNARKTDVRFEGVRSYPERPESEVEWEDLLLRLELMPRALKVELEGRRGVEVAGIVASLAERELAVQRLLEEVAMAGIIADPAPSYRDAPSGPAILSDRTPDRPGEHGTTGSAGPFPRPPTEASRDPSTGLSTEADLDRFVRLRGRNFAMLQRRGIDVWNWRIRLPPDDDATVFQLLSLLGRNDVETLSRLRTARKPMPGPC